MTGQLSTWLVPIVVTVEVRATTKGEAWRKVLSRVKAAIAGVMAEGTVDGAEVHGR